MPKATKENKKSESKKEKEPKLLKNTETKKLGKSETKGIKSSETKKIGISKTRAKKIKHSYNVKDAENSLLLKLKTVKSSLRCIPTRRLTMSNGLKNLSAPDFTTA